MRTIIALLALATALGACEKKDKPAKQAAQDIKTMGEQRDKARDAAKALEESRQKAREAVDKMSDGEGVKN